MGENSYWRSIKEFFIGKAHKKIKLRQDDAHEETNDRSNQFDQPKAETKEEKEIVDCDRAGVDADFEQSLHIIDSENLGNANIEETGKNQVEMQYEEEDMCNSEAEEEDLEFSECAVNTIDIVNNGDSGLVCLKSCLKSKASSPVSCPPRQAAPSIHVSWSPDVKEPVNRISFKKMVERQHARQKEKALLRSRKHCSLYRKSATNNRTSIMKNYGAISLSPYFGCELFSANDVPLF